MSEVKYPDCLNDEAKTLNCYVFDYINNAYQDEIAGAVKEWGKLQDKKETPDQTFTPKNGRGE